MLPGLTAKPERTWAVVIGIDEYKLGPGFNLRGPVGSADRFADWLIKQGVPQPQIIRLKSGVAEPTDEEVHEVFTGRTLRAGGDLLVIYWAGHGVMDRDTRRLICADAQPGNVRNLNLDSLRRYLRSDHGPRFRDTVLFIDACAAPIPEGGWPDRSFPNGNDRSGARQFTLVAARSGQQTRANVRAEVGRFTEALLAHLGDAAATPLNLRALADGLKMHFDSVSDGGRQTPAYFAWETEDPDDGYKTGAWPAHRQAKPAKSTTPVAPSKVFISYSHEDRKFLERLKVFFKPLERAGLVEPWDDTRIKTGMRRREEIERALSSARVAVLLISADFLASDFISNEELPHLLAAGQDQGLVVMPVIVGPCRFARTPSLSQFQAVNHPDRPLSAMTEVEQDTTWTKLVDDIEDALSPKPPPPENAPSPGTITDWGEANQTGAFIGRVVEFERLAGLLSSLNTRVLTIIGMGGLGKTTLAFRAAASAASQFRYVFWRDLRNSPPVEETLADCLKLISGNRDKQRPGDLESLLTEFSECTEKNRCLVVLDNFESVMRAGSPSGEYRESFEGYRKLLDRMIRRRNQSCLFLTSRELPQPIDSYGESDARTPIYRLSGMIETDCGLLLEDSGLSIEPKYTSALRDRYNGNPLALKLAADFIARIYSGDADRFLNDLPKLFGSLRMMLDAHFERLPGDALDELYWLAIERDWVSFRELLDESLHPLTTAAPSSGARNELRRITESELVDTVTTFERLSLLERSGDRFRLQPLMLEYVTDSLVERIQAEIVSGQPRLLRTHALMRAESREYVRLMQKRLIIKPVCDGLLKLRPLPRVRDMLRSIAESERADRGVLGGFVVGNCVNLLLHLGTDLSGADFSNTAIWQSDFRDTHCHDLDLTGADLKGSVFRDAFSVVYSVALTARGDLLAAGTDDGEVRVWETHSGQLLRSIKEHDKRVRSVAFSTDGSLLASAGLDGKVRIFRCEDYQCLRVPTGHESAVMSIAFGTETGLLASGGDDGCVRLWGVSDDGQDYLLARVGAQVKTVAFSPDGALLAAAGQDGIVRIWDIATKDQVAELIGHKAQVWAVAFSPTGDRVASGDLDGKLKLWEFPGGKPLRTYEHPNWVLSVAFSPDAASLITGCSDGIIRIWDARGDDCLNLLEGHNNLVWSVALSRSCDLLASGSEDQSVRLWSLPTGRALKTIQGYSNPIRSLAFEASGNRLLSGCGDHAVRLWEVPGGRCTWTMIGHRGAVRSVCFDPTGTRAISGGEDRRIRIWDCNTGECLRELNGHTNWVMGLAVAPRLGLFASGSSDATVRLWSLNSWQTVDVIDEHTELIRSIAIGPGESPLLAVGTGDHRSIRLRNLASRQPVGDLMGHEGWVVCLSFHPSGRYLASGSNDRTLRIWDTETLDCVKIVTKDCGAVRCISYSPCGQHLASGHADNSIRIWDSQSGCQLGRLTGHLNDVKSLAYCPVTGVLASGSDDETMRVWANGDSGECHTLRARRPYEGMKLSDSTGLSAAQRLALLRLGALE